MFASSNSIISKRCVHVLATWNAGICSVAAYPGKFEVRSMLLFSLAICKLPNRLKQVELYIYQFGLASKLPVHMACYKFVLFT